MQIENKSELKNKIKALKKEQFELRQQLQSLPKAESKNRNEHLKRQNGRFVSSLSGEKLQKQFMLRATTIDLIANNAAQEGLSMSEAVDRLIENALNSENQTESEQRKPLSFKI